MLRRSWLSLRLKTLLTIAATIAALLVVSLVPLRALLLRSYLELERETLAADLGRIEGAIASAAAEVDSAVLAWSSWDDTYAFVEQPTQAYIDANLSDNWFQQYELNVMLFARADGSVVASRAFDLEGAAEAPVPPELLARFGSPASIPQFSDLGQPRSGLVLLPQGPLLAVQRPVLTSDGRGPSRGVVLFGRFLTEKELGALAEIYQVPFMLQPLASQSALAEADQAALLRGEPAIQLLSEEQIAGFTLLRDLDGQPALLARVGQARTIYAQGQRQLLALSAALAIGGLVIGLAVLGLIDLLILRRLARVSGEVAAAGGQSGARVTDQGGDELGRLGAAINAMLAARERLAEERDAAERGQLEALERQASEQRALVAQLQQSLDERRQLSDTIRSLAVPVLPALPGVLVVPLVGSFDAARADDLREAVLGAAERQRARHVILDITATPLIDTQVALALIGVAQALRLLGAQATLVGIRPEVAQTLVQLGVDLSAQHVAADLESALVGLARQGLAPRAR